MMGNTLHILTKLYIFNAKQKEEEEHGGEIYKHEVYIEILYMITELLICFQIISGN